MSALADNGPNVDANLSRLADSVVSARMARCSTVMPALSWQLIASCECVAARHNCVMTWTHKRTARFCLHYLASALRALTEGQRVAVVVWTMSLLACDRRRTNKVRSLSLSVYLSIYLSISLSLSLSPPALPASTPVMFVRARPGLLCLIDFCCCCCCLRSLLSGRQIAVLFDKLQNRTGGDETPAGAEKAVRAWRAVHFAQRVSPLTLSLVPAL